MPGGVTQPHPLLDELHLKKQHFRRIAAEVGCMASQLRGALARMAVKEETLQREIDGRKAAEANAMAMEEEMASLCRRLEEQTAHAASASSVAQHYQKELVDLRSALASMQEFAKLNATATASAQLQCFTLKKQLEMKTADLQMHKAIALLLLKQIKDETSSEKQPRFEHRFGLMERPKVATMASLEEFLLEGPQQLSNGLKMKDDEVELLLSELKMKTQDVEAQVWSGLGSMLVTNAEMAPKTVCNDHVSSLLDNYQKERYIAVEQELMKTILKFEFWIQAAQAQTMKVQKIIMKREKQLREQDSQRQLTTAFPKGSILGVWGNPSLRLIISFALVGLLICAKR